MKNIGININSKKDPNEKILNQILKYIDKDKYSVYIFKDTKGIKSICSKLNFIITIGGDGTVLKTAKECYEFSIPIFGLNFGNLGFLTTAEKDKLKYALDKLFLHEYYIEERMMLTCNIEGKDKKENLTALNEIVIARSTISRVGKFNIWIDNHFYSEYISDGVIISTPTGSTAYSLSAGGPIIFPTMELISIIPICPLSVNIKSLILNSESTIIVKLKEEIDEAYVTIDGQKSYKLNTNDIIRISKCPEKVKLIKLNDYNYYDNLRKKIIYRINGYEGEC